MTSTASSATSAIISPRLPDDPARAARRAAPPNCGRTAGLATGPGAGCGVAGGTGTWGAAAGRGLLGGLVGGGGRRRGRPGGLARRTGRGGFAGRDAALRDVLEVTAGGGDRCPGEVTGGREALVGLLRHAPLDHLGHRLRDVLLDLRHDRRGVVQVRVHLGDVGLADERHLAGERVVEHAAQRVDV